MDYSSFVDQLNQEVSSGNSFIVQKKLKSLNLKQVPRRFRVPLANLSWRSGIPYWGMKLMAPVMMSEQAQARDDATAIEQIEYSLLLQKIGSISEALLRLSKINSEKNPKTLLYRAFCHFSLWESDQAGPVLEKYINENSLSLNDQLVGEVNLLAAYIGAQQFEKATELSNSLQESLKTNQKTKLLGNVFELKAQIDIYNNDLKSAENNLEQSRLYLLNDTSASSLFLKKWSAYLEAYKVNDVEPLLRFKKEAQKAQHSETLRDVDMLLLKINFDKKLFKRLIYGTPYESFHNRAKAFLGIDLPFQETEQLGESQNILNLQKGTLNEKAIINPGKDIHKLLYTLCSDLYRPWSLGALHEKLWPDEYFNVFSSPNKIHQLVHRTKSLIKDNKLKLKIESSELTYSMNTEKQSLILDLNKKTPDFNEFLLEKIKNHFSEEEFTSKDVRKEFNYSKSSLQRFFQWCEDENRLIVKKSGKVFYYQFQNNKKSA